MLPRPEPPGDRVPGDVPALPPESEDALVEPQPGDQLAVLDPKEPAARLNLVQVRVVPILVLVERKRCGHRLTLLFRYLLWVTGVRRTPLLLVQSGRGFAR